MLFYRCRYTQTDPRATRSRRDREMISLPPIEVLVLAPLIVLTANVIFSISGFGLTLIAVPLLAHLMPLKFVIPMVVLIDCVGCVSLGIRHRADVNRGELAPLLPFTLIGLALGAFLLVRLRADLLLAGLGIFALTYGFVYAIKRKAPVRLARWTAVPLGLAGGTCSATFGVGGPMYILFLTGRGATPTEIRATMAVLFVFSTVTRIILFALAGLFSTEIFLTAALLLPAMFLGLWIGQKLHGRLNRDHLVRFIGGLLMASGASLLVRAAS